MYFLITRIAGREPDGHIVSGTLFAEESRIWDVEAVALTEDERAMLEALESRIGERLARDGVGDAVRVTLRHD